MLSFFLRLILSSCPNTADKAGKKKTLLCCRRSCRLCSSWNQSMTNWWQLEYVCPNTISVSKSVNIDYNRGQTWNGIVLYTYSSNCQSNTSAQGISGYYRCLKKNKNDCRSWNIQHVKFTEGVFITVAPLCKVSQHGNVVRKEELAPRVFSPMCQVVFSL